jgi:chromosome partitioning protein
MAVTISVGIQKGGVGKTTTAGLTSWLLSQEARVLAVDFDSQGNLTYFLSQRNIYDFTKRTVLEACIHRDPRPYIYPVTDNLHLLPAEDLLSTYSRYIYQDYAKVVTERTRRGEKANVLYLLKETLDVVQDQYDYIIIDLPPNLGEQTLSGLAASDFALVILQCEPFCYDALERYLELLQHVQSQLNPSLRLAGILTTMLDARTALGHTIVEKAREEYEDLVFQTTIRRRSRIQEFSAMGIQDRTKDDHEALQQYKAFLEELKARCRARKTSSEA